MMTYRWKILNMCCVGLVALPILSRAGVLDEMGFGESASLFVINRTLDTAYQEHSLCRQTVDQQLLFEDRPMSHYQMALALLDNPLWGSRHYHRDLKSDRVLKQYILATPEKAATTRNLVGLTKLMLNESIDDVPTVAIEWARLLGLGSQVPRLVELLGSSTDADDRYEVKRIELLAAIMDLAPGHARDIIEAMYRQIRPVMGPAIDPPLIAAAAFYDSKQWVRFRETLANLSIFNVRRTDAFFNYEARQLLLRILHIVEVYSGLKSSQVIMPLYLTTLSEPLESLLLGLSQNFQSDFELSDQILRSFLMLGIRGQREAELLKILKIWQNADLQFKDQSILYLNQTLTPWLKKTLTAWYIGSEPEAQQLVSGLFEYRDRNGHRKLKFFPDVK